MNPIKNPAMAALIAGVLRYLWLRYPDYRDMIDAIAAGLGIFIGMPVVAALGGIRTNGANGNSTSNPGYPNVNPPR